MVNKAIILGHLGKEPELKQLENGTICTFSVATSESYKNKQGEKVETTEWHNCTLWGSQAEIAAKYLTKGSKIYLEGKIETRTYEKDGEKRHSTGIKVFNFKMLDGKPKEETASVGDLPF